MEVTFGGEGLVAGGDVRVEDAGVTLPGTPEIRVDGLALQLPFRLDLRTIPGWVPPFASDAPTGTASLGVLTVGSERVVSRPFPVRLWDSTLDLPEGMELEGFGGILTLNPSFAHGLFGERTGSFSGGIQGMELGRVCEAFDLPSLGGRVNAVIPAVRLDGDRLAMDGTAEFELFGGEVELHDLWVRAGAGVLGFSCEFRQLDLEQVTKVIPVGYMSGGLQGYVRNCAFSLERELPVGFEVELRSDDSVDLPRKISVAALVTMVSLAQGDAGKYMGILGQMETWGYRELGLHAELKDNRFKVVGLVNKDQVDYVLLGSGRHRVNVQTEMGKRGYSFDRILTSLLNRIRQIEEGRFDELKIVDE